RDSPPKPRGAGPDLSPLVVHRHTDDLSELGRWLLRRAEAEMVQDPADRDGVGDVGNDLERATAAFADERIGLIDLGASENVAAAHASAAHDPSAGGGLPAVTAHRGRPRS